ncbi:hypothetical protein BJV78DRAFT_88112 [Lactifluus subvellereus]|nr:hypothetical protein BJV78DRAFT_88112 [Lactifluus subvellereus]
MFSIDLFTLDHLETPPTSERGAPPRRSLTWQPSPSPLRHVSSPPQHSHTPLSPPPPSPAIWSRLPIELVTQILLYAAFASRADSHAFCLVSSAVRRAVLPALYHNVLLRYAGQVGPFVSPFTAKSRPSPYQYYYSPSASPRNHNTGDNAKLLAHIPIHALALALPTKRPSLEAALARIAPALASLEHLALTAPLLSAHAHWLRAAPHIRPRTLMLYHLGRPVPVHFGEPFLQDVTHLYTSTLTGFRGTSPASLPALTHLALITRATQPQAVIDEVLAGARRVLATCPNLAILVLALDHVGLTVPSSTSGGNGNGTLQGPGAPAIILPPPWCAALARQRDPRLHVLPFALHPRLMWRGIVGDSAGSGDQDEDAAVGGARDVFAYAQAWREAQACGATTVMLRLAAEVAARNDALDSWKEDEWDLDLMTAPGYIHGRNADEGETDTPAVQW